MSEPRTARQLDYELLLREFQVAFEEGDGEACMDREWMLLSMWLSDVLAAGRLTPELMTQGHRINNLGREDVIR